jgi:hypothetical protein
MNEFIRSDADRSQMTRMLPFFRLLSKRACQRIILIFYQDNRQGRIYGRNGQIHQFLACEKCHKGKSDI